MYVGNGVGVAGTAVGVGTGLEVAVGTTVGSSCVPPGRANVGADVSVDGGAAIDLPSPPELLRANTRPTANIAAITPMTVSIAKPKDFLILVFNYS